MIWIKKSENLGYKSMDFLSIFYSLLLATLLMHCNGSKREIHIVYMGDKPRGEFSATSTHHSMLESMLGSTSLAKESLVFSYGRSFNGFAAHLTAEEAERFSEMEGVVSVMPNQKLELHTTRSWDFVGLPASSFRGPSREGDVIVGFMDTGIWPESGSFTDNGMSPPPAKWKGKCEGVNFTCNNKIIGARYYNSENYYSKNEYKSPRDALGHGSHTSSTAAGREVSGAGYFGLGGGLARGGVPNARIAVYKVCWDSSACTSANILAAFDDAIADGVDIISVSLGGYGNIPYMKDVIAIGSFHAMRHGILTSTSAGNYGPELRSVTNYSPWTLTVAASTIDRKFIANVVLGNGQVFTGLSINNFDLNGTSYPLIWGGDAANYSAGIDPGYARFCFRGELNSDMVAGKIVFCETNSDGSGPLLANGVATIMSDSFFSYDFALNFPLPATIVRTEDGQKILEYIRSTKNPVATILVGESWNDIMAPSVVSFSSRGPNPVTPDILKPDITAPGVDILAAWPPVVPPSFYEDDKRSVQFNILSGTSMSCPHASGAAAYVKAAHPGWSPAAIKSALMTTAFPIDSRKHAELEFAYGSGHINPVKAANPGLIYDTSEADYINFLCKQGYNTTTLRLITGDNSTYCNSTQPGRAWDLNYPSFSVAVEDGHPIYALFTRTVTNVGYANSNYSIATYMPNNVNIVVNPPFLSFSSVGEKKTFTVKVYGPKIKQQPITSGAIFWSDGVHVVRSPIVVYTILPGATYYRPKSLFQISSGSTTHRGPFLTGGKHVLRRN